MKSKRETNYELLRIVSMVMITVLHYMSHGGMLTSWHEGAAAMTAPNATAWALEAVCLPGMSCFIMLSGYFLKPEKWRASRIVELILQCLFYSLTIPLIAVLTGAVSVSDIDRYDILNWCFPIGSECWWFMSSYIILYALSPLLSAGAEKMSRTNLRWLILCMVFFESIEKTILPVVLPTDRFGYDPLWMVTMFLIARYIKLYGAEFLDKKAVPVIAYILSCAGMFAMSFITGRIAAGGVEGLVRYSEMPYTCNYFLTMFASISLFCIFRHITIEDGLFSRIVLFISPLLLGAYLVHEHPLIRGLWPGWFFADQVRGSMLFAPVTIAGALAVLIVGCAYELIRSGVAGIIRRRVNKHTA